MHRRWASFLPRRMKYKPRESITAARAFKLALMGGRSEACILSSFLLEMLQPNEHLVRRAGFQPFYSHPKPTLAVHQHDECAVQEQIIVRGPLIQGLIDEDKQELLANKASDSRRGTREELPSIGVRPESRRVTAQHRWRVEFRVGSQAD